MKTIFDEVRNPQVGRRLSHLVRPRLLKGVEWIGREERREKGQEQYQEDRHQLHYRRKTVLLQINVVTRISLHGLHKFMKVFTSRRLPLFDCRPRGGDVGCGSAVESALADGISSLLGPRCASETHRRRTC